MHNRNELKTHDPRSLLVLALARMLERQKEPQKPPRLFRKRRESLPLFESRGN